MNQFVAIKPKVGQTLISKKHRRVYGRVTSVDGQSVRYRSEKDGAIHTLPVGWEKLQYLDEEYRFTDATVGGLVSAGYAIPPERG